MLLISHSNTLMTLLLFHQGGMMIPIKQSRRVSYGRREYNGDESPGCDLRNSQQIVAGATVRRRRKERIR
jgi:hypothetical protein